MTAPVVVVEPVTVTPPLVVSVTVHVTLQARIKSALEWGLGMFLDETGKPSMSRILFFLWTIVGWVMIWHEIQLVAGQPAILNAAWQAWWAADGFLGFCVFGPRIAAYFAAGAAGSVSAGAIAGSIRDAVVAVIPGATAATTAPSGTVTTAPLPNPILDQGDKHG